MSPADESTLLRDLLRATADHAADYLEGVDERPVKAAQSYEEILTALDRPVPDDAEDPRAVLDALVAGATPGITGMNHPRFFGFVIGGALPAALAADWMVSAWDQNAGLALPTPAVAAIEEIAGRWLVDILGLPRDASFGLVTGCQMAHATCLAAARHAVLRDAGWDVETGGLQGAPRIRVVAGAERHATVDRALRLLGLGTDCIEPVAVDDAGAMRADALAEMLAGAQGPLIVCAQAGNVNTGAIDPLADVAEIARRAGAWLHVDGAFGLWAAASPRHRGSVAGIERADSWATDAHKWLNVPYDCGVAIVADSAAHRGAMSVTASYLEQTAGPDALREPVDWTPEFSRRARGVPVYAALCSLGRDGVAELVDRLCACAWRFAATLDEDDRVEVLATGLNQTLLGFAEGVDVDAVTAALAAEGTCLMTATTWRGRRCLRVSVCNWKTTFADVDRAVGALRSVV
ncbi:MAG TPA: aminotransferase class V-fold PLP-dependent enzyme [Solirubrobacteraceae bacterium]